MTLSKDTWNENKTIGSSKQWRNIAMSSDGKRQTAVVFSEIFGDLKIMELLEQDTSVGQPNNGMV